MPYKSKEADRLWHREYMRQKRVTPLLHPVTPLLHPVTPKEASPRDRLLEQAGVHLDGNSITLQQKKPLLSVPNNPKPYNPDTNYSPVISGLLAVFKPSFHPVPKPKSRKVRHR